MHHFPDFNGFVTDNCKPLLAEINASAPLKDELKHLKLLGVEPRLLREGKLRRNKRGLAEGFAIALYGGGPKHFSHKYHVFL